MRYRSSISFELGASTTFNRAPPRHQHVAVSSVGQISSPALVRERDSLVQLIGSAMTARAAMRSCWRLMISFPFSSSPIFYRSEETTSELQTLMRNSYAVFCLKKQ